MGQKVLALFLMCLLGFGSYFCFDNPGALQVEIKDVMGVTTEQFANLYGWYSWPNVVLPVFGGYLLDSVLGLRLGATFFALALIVGQCLFALGGYLDSFTLMNAGRFAFGIGGESLAVAQNTYATAWFSGGALNMVFGLQLSIARLGSTANFQVVGPLYHYLIETMGKNEALGTTLLIAGTSCVMSFVSAVILAFVDRRRERVLRKEETAPETENVARASCGDIFHFPPSFYVLCLICVCYYVAIFPFVSLGQTFFMGKFAMDSSSANMVNGLIYLISAFASPAFGFVIDRVGRNLIFVNVAVVVTIVGHCMLAFTFVNPYVGVIMIGCAYSLCASALWPMVTYVVPERQLGTAFGLMQAVQNLGLGLVSVAAGDVVDIYGYQHMELFFGIFLVVALMATAWLTLMDHRGDRTLNMSAKQRAAVAKWKVDQIRRYQNQAPE